jgi:N utilization substance protein B
MISRRLVRIKTLQTLYSWNQGHAQDVGDLKKELFSKIQTTEQFYLFLLDFPYELQQFAKEKQDLEKSKYYPDQFKIKYYDNLNYTRFIPKMHETLIVNNVPQTQFEWSNLANYFEEWYKRMREWDFVQDYQFFTEPTEQQQLEFVEQILFTFLETQGDFNDCLEEVYPQWFDDNEYTVRDVLKSLKLQAGRATLSLKDAIRPNNEEVALGAQILTKTIANNQEYESLISAVTDNWDPSRIAVIDLLILKMAITEFLHCPEIPLKVTINEYLEITKNYSTPNSSKFVNGIMDKLRMDLSKNDRIQKTGRGLL